MRYIFLKPIKTAEDKRNAAALPRMRKAELQKLIEDRTETKVVTPKTAAASRAASAVFRQALRDDLARDLGRSNHSLAGLLKLRPAAITSTPTIKQGNREFKLLSPESLLTDAYCHGKLRSNAAHAMQKLTWLYNTVEQVAFKDLSKKQRDALKKFAPAPNLKLADIYKRIQSLAALSEIWRPIAAAALLGAGEQGGGPNTDQTPISVECSGRTPNPKGLITVCNWPLKPHITSVKDQGDDRGTCSAFGAVAAVETAVSIKYGQRLNLSEQDLYKHQMFDWNPNPFDDYYDEGYFPLLGMLFQMGSGYVFPFERDWNYNQSRSRVDDKPRRKYSHSCDGYNGLACSDTNHQAAKVCSVIRTTEVKEVVTEVCEFAEGIPFLGIVAGWVCNAVTGAIETVEETEVCVFETEVNGTSRIKATGFLPVWDPIWDNDIAAAKTLLRARVPLIFCFTVAASWGEPHSSTDGRGFIVYSARETAPLAAGGHCVQLVGCVDNVELPASAGISPGAGGGYFIVKNSWSECWGDMGFAYVPYSWVDKWGAQIVSITNVERI